jgi:hypothetical protein
MQYKFVSLQTQLTGNRWSRRRMNMVTGSVGRFPIFIYLISAGDRPSFNQVTFNVEAETIDRSHLANHWYKPQQMKSDPSRHLGISSRTDQ